MGLKNVIMTDRKGAIYEGRDGLNPVKEEMAKITNFGHEAGSLADVIRGADVFIGVSAPGTLTQDMVRSMARDPIVFACANPTPEIFPDEAKAAGAAVVSTGRSDFPNQVNNVLCFPGIFRQSRNGHVYWHSGQQKPYNYPSLLSLYRPGRFSRCSKLQKPGSHQRRTVWQKR